MGSGSHAYRVPLAQRRRQGLRVPRGAEVGLNDEVLDAGVVSDPLDATRAGHHVRIPMLVRRALGRDGAQRDGGLLPGYPAGVLPPL